VPVEPAAGVTVRAERRRDRTVSAMMPASSPTRRHAPASTALIVTLALVVSACLSEGGGGDAADPAGDPAGSASPGTGVGEAPGPGLDASDEVQDCTDPRSMAHDVQPEPARRPSGAAAGPPVPRLVEVDPSRPIEMALARSATSGPVCARRVVLVTSADPAARALAGARAVLEGVPLIVASVGPDAVEPPTAAWQAELRGRLVDLGVEEIEVVGPVPMWVRGQVARVVELAGPEVDRVGFALELLGGRAVQGGGRDPGAEPSLVLVQELDVAAQAEVVARAAHGAVPVVLPPDAAAARALLEDLASRPEVPLVVWAASSDAHAHGFAALLAGAEGGAELLRWTAPSGPGEVAELWLGDVRDVGGALGAAVVAAARGAAFVAVDGSDLRSGVERTARMRAAHAHPDGDVEVVLVGAVEQHTTWQLDTVMTGTTLPGGGFLPLEDRRIVALYGSPGTPSLGMLGAQDDPATIARAREVADRYGDAPDGRTVVPGLDVIVTIASSAAEPTGDYSRRVPIARLRPLVDLASEAGVAVFLDLQPGRTSFVVQAKEYEDLLREPHVHLALDPEWRIGPQERHLVRIGSVSAEEVQQVADWLAALVRRERLPQKVLMLHQFTAAMLPERDTIEIPAELIGVVHVDGQGPLPTKDRTYAALSGGSEGRWAWGWKNFSRIDVPVATPEQTLDRSPVPVVVTYQ